LLENSRIRIEMQYREELFSAFWPTIHLYPFDVFEATKWPRVSKLRRTD
jgi:hypothetical protein